MLCAVLCPLIRAVLASESNFRWLWVVLMLGCVLWLGLESGSERRKGMLDGDVQVRARRSRYPPECLPHAFSTPNLAVLQTRDAYWRNTAHVKQLRAALNNKWIHMVSGRSGEARSRASSTPSLCVSVVCSDFLQSGDSTLRDTYYQLVSLLESSAQLGEALSDPELIAHRQATRHAPQQHLLRSGVAGAADGSGSPGVIRLSFEWSPYVSNVTTDLRLELLGPTRAPPDLMLLSAGLWDLLYGPPPPHTSGINAQRLQSFDALAQSTAGFLMEQGFKLHAVERKKRLKLPTAAATAAASAAAAYPLIRSEEAKGYSDWQPKL